MTNVILPVLALAVAAVITYVCCVRPTRHRPWLPPGDRSKRPEDRALDAELTAARTELAHLRSNRLDSPEQVGSPAQSPLAR